MNVNVNELHQGIKEGDIRSLSRGITLVESRLESDYVLADELMDLCTPISGGSHRIAITGIPGVGKSTFIESLGSLYIEGGKKVAVLAVDPTSTLSQGSILGDKTRMEKLSASSQAFIRPSASANTLGGVARKTRESIILCEAAGFDTVFIETVGVGQSETAVRSMVDTFLLLMLAGAGDELQGIKRGIMEMADILLVNKVEEDNMEKARIASSDYRAALHLLSGSSDQWTTKVEMVSSLNGFHMKKARNLMDEHWVYLKDAGRLQAERKEQDIAWFKDALREEILHQFYEDSEKAERVKRLKEAVENGNTSPLVAARRATKN